MGRNVVETISETDKAWSVEIFQGTHGRFGFEESHHGIDEQSWFTYGRYSEAFTDGSEAAIRETSARVSWAANEEENHK